MKMKYFLRGLGAGIVFSAIVLLVAYMTSGGYRISDDDIIERAEKLGMVMREDPINNASTDASTGDLDDTNETSEALTGEGVTTESTTEATTEATTESTTESTTEANAEATTEATTEVTTEVTTEATTETTTEEIPSGDVKTVEITVTRGMGSLEVCKLIQNSGIIEDAVDFDNYLNKNGYATKIRVNTFTLRSDMTYEEIAKVITTGGN